MAICSALRTCLTGFKRFAECFGMQHTCLQRLPSRQNAYLKTVALSSPKHQAHLGMLKEGLRILAHRGSLALLLVGLDPANVLTPPETPLRQAVPASIQPLCTPAPAHILAC